MPDKSFKTVLSIIEEGLNQYVRTTRDSLYSQGEQAVTSLVNENIVHREENEGATASTAGEELEKTGEQQDKTDEELEKTGVELEKTGVELEKTGVELEKTGVELEKTGVELEKTGVELEKTSVELDETGVELDETGVELDETGEELEKTVEELSHLKLEDSLHEAEKKFQGSIYLELKVLQDKILRDTNDLESQEEILGKKRATHTELSEQLRALEELLKPVEPNQKKAKGNGKSQSDAKPNQSLQGKKRAQEQLKSNQAPIEEQLEILNKEISELETSIESLRRSIEDHRGKIRALEKQIEEIEYKEEQKLKQAKEQETQNTHVQGLEPKEEEDKQGYEDYLPIESVTQKQDISNKQDVMTTGVGVSDYVHVPSMTFAYRMVEAATSALAHAANTTMKYVSGDDLKLAKINLIEREFIPTLVHVDNISELYDFLKSAKIKHSSLKGVINHNEGSLGALLEIFSNFLEDYEQYKLLTELSEHTSPTMTHSLFEYEVELLLKLMFEKAKVSKLVDLEKNASFYERLRDRVEHPKLPGATIMALILCLSNNIHKFKNKLIFGINDKEVMNSSFLELVKIFKDASSPWMASLNSSHLKYLEELQNDIYTKKSEIENKMAPKKQYIS